MQTTSAQQTWYVFSKQWTCLFLTIERTAISFACITACKEVRSGLWLVGGSNHRRTNTQTLGLGTAEVCEQMVSKGSAATSLFGYPKTVAHLGVGVDCHDFHSHHCLHPSPTPHAARAIASELCLHHNLLHSAEAVLLLTSHRKPPEC